MPEVEINAMVNTDFEQEHRVREERLKNEINLLSSTKVLTDMFKIESLGQFGTINGLRLGRLANDVVPWQEINAAWG